MKKITNSVGCVAAAWVFSQFALGEFDQEIVRNSSEWVFWLPVAWFGGWAVANVMEW